MEFRQRYTYDTKTDMLGKGGFATVYRANDTLLKRTVAVKFYTNPGGKKYDLLSEIRRSIGLQHANICRYYDALVLQGRNIHGDIEHTEVGIMEYLDGGNIMEYLKTHPQYLHKLLADTLNGIAYLHQKNIVHRDIKPGNVLIKLPGDGSEVPIAKITDLGISKELGADAKNSTYIVGSLAYIAPEQLEPLTFGINEAAATNADIWSFGVMVYELVTGKMLFEGIDTQTGGQAMNRVLSEDISKKIAAVKVPYRELLQKCLVRKASDRCRDCEELIGIIEGYSKPGAEPVQNREVTIRIERTNRDVTSTATVQRPRQRDPKEAPRSIFIRLLRHYRFHFLVCLLALVVFAIMGLWITFHSNTQDEVFGQDSLTRKEQPPAPAPIASIYQDDLAPLLSEEEQQKRRRYFGTHELYFSEPRWLKKTIGGWWNRTLLAGQATILPLKGGYYLNGTQKSRDGKEWININGTITMFNSGILGFSFDGNIAKHIRNKQGEIIDNVQRELLEFELVDETDRRYRSKRPQNGHISLWPVEVEILL